MEKASLKNWQRLKSTDFSRIYVIELEEAREVSLPSTELNYVIYDHDYGAQAGIIEFRNIQKEEA